MTITAGPSTFAATYTQNPINDMAHTNGDIITRVDATYTYNCILYKQTDGSCMPTDGYDCWALSSTYVQDECDTVVHFPGSGLGVGESADDDDGFIFGGHLDGFSSSCKHGGDAYFDVNWDRKKGMEAEWEQVWLPLRLAY